MTPINQLHEAIKNDPYGEVAQRANHFLAVEVMGWFVDEKGYWMDSATHKTPEGLEFPLGSLEDDWRPFTDANHTRVLVREFKFLCSERKVQRHWVFQRP